MKFKQFLEISLSPDFPELKLNSPKARSSSKIIPTGEKARIIPVRVGYDIYNVFIRYSDNNRIISDLMDRRGDGVDPVIINFSNEEVDSMRRLAEFILANSNKKEEILVANKALKAISQAAH